MTDVILSSFISLFALFGKEEQVDEMRAKNLLVDYLHRHFGIRNTDIYLDLYSDMRMAYEMTDGLNTIDTVTSICANLQGDIRNRDKALLLLRLMAFCCQDGASTFLTNNTTISKTSYSIAHQTMLNYITWMVLTDN